MFTAQSLLIIEGFNIVLNYNILLFYSINNGLENNILNFIMPLLTNFGSLVAWCIICGFLYLFGGNKAKKVAILGLMALFISNGLIYLLKPIIAEPRPFLVLGNVHQLVPENEIYSFPSGHTASSFAAATVIGLNYALKLGNKTFKLIYPLTIFAAVIGFSRIYIGIHYPLDIIFGAFIGVSCALTVLKLEKSIFQNKYLREIGLEKITNIDTAGLIKKVYKN
ncbi:MAG: phosphatase PAP2 family protein [Methanobacterium sp.]